MRLLCRPSADGRGASLIAALPRARYGAALRDRLVGIVRQAYGAVRVDLHEVLGEGDRTQLHLSVHDPDGLRRGRPARRSSIKLQTLARTWDDRVRGELVERHGPERGGMLAARWLQRLPDSYRAAAEPRGRRRGRRGASRACSPAPSRSRSGCRPTASAPAWRSTARARRSS